MILFSFGPNGHQLKSPDIDANQSMVDQTGSLSFFTSLFLSFFSFLNFNNVWAIVVYNDAGGSPAEFIAVFLSPCEKKNSKQRQRIE